MPFSVLLGHDVTERPAPRSTAYLCGPMSGIDDFNFPAFRLCAAHLRSLGYFVLDPSENFDGKQDLPYEVYLRRGIEQVLLADFVAVLPGWEFSHGANAELTVARVLKLPILDGATLEPVSD